MPSFRLQDLTGKVRKTEKYYFANGGLADIWKGEWSRRGLKQTVAVKVLRSAWGNTDYLEQLKMKLLREAKLWSRLDHPNITPFYGISFDLGAPSAPCLVCPYFRNGNVAKYLEKNPNADRDKLISQVAAGLAYLHRHGIVHGDIKSSNILVNDEGEACITDFGLARILEASGFTTKSVGGTCRWMAYELIAPSDEEEEEIIPQVTVATDIWAFGMTALEIFTGKLPFFQLKFDTAVILSVMRGGRPKHEIYPAISHSTWATLERCWHTDPTQRPSMEDLSVFFGTMPPKPVSDSDRFKATSSLGPQASATYSKKSRTVLGSRDLNGGSLSKPDGEFKDAVKSRRTNYWPLCDAGCSNLCDCPDHTLFHPEVRKPHR